VRSSTEKAVVLNLAASSSVGCAAAQKGPMLQSKHQDTAPKASHEEEIRPEKEGTCQSRVFA